MTVVMPPVRWLTCNVRHSSTVRQASKKEIERLERELKPKPEPQPKAATRTPRKTRSATPAKRGRPKKKAS